MALAGAIDGLQAEETLQREGLRAFEPEECYRLGLLAYGAKQAELLRAKRIELAMADAERESS